ncbi:hypothetical protein KF913_16190 [Candidatus Obscuribacterales bacterium]|nr:hypothetical protein [Candidatus Obscuribacterales bacterium]
MPKFFVSLFIFLLIALWFGQFASFVQNRYEYPLHSWSWWTVKELRSIAGISRSKSNVREPSPNTVLLGSSLMVVANAECDATWSNERLDLTTYRKARYFDEVMASADELNECCSINLSAPGQIPSDAFLTLQEAVNEGLHPSLVIYGIAPRDFIDSTMSSPFETEGYKYLSRLVSTERIDSKLRDGVVQNLNRQLLTSIPLLRYAVDLQMACSKSTLELRDSLLRRGFETMSLEKRMALISTYKPLDMVPGFIHAEIANEAEVEKLYADNLSDYKARYARPKAEFYDGQLSCLEELARFCMDNQIGLVVVNMPIRKCNLDLLSPGIRSKYLADVSHISTEYGAEFVDLCEVDNYSKGDYRDSVHLNGFGGRKFLDRLVAAIADQSVVSKSLRRRVPRVAARETLESPL